MVITPPLPTCRPLTQRRRVAEVGLGLHYAVGERSTIDLRGIYHHISNANISQENPSLNSALFSIGFTFLY